MVLENRSRAPHSSRLVHDRHKLTNPFAMVYMIDTWFASLISELQRRKETSHLLHYAPADSLSLTFNELMPIRRASYTTHVSPLPIVRCESFCFRKTDTPNGSCQSDISVPFIPR